jgi:hypothetical protein
VVYYLIRVQLPDRPGALGAVASRIGSVGGDVVSIDILQRQGGVVVDELGVGLAGDNLIGLLSAEILEVDGVTIESVRPVDGALPDRNTELLDVATDLFRQTSPTELLDHLTVRVRRMLAATFAVAVDPAGPEPAMVAGDGQPPVLAEWVDGGEERTDLAVAPMGRSGLILLVGRADPVLRQRERQWIATMAELADHRWEGLT